MTKPTVVIGIAGGSGSGKTTVARRILERTPAPNVAILSQDNYYRDYANLPLAEREKINFDHPDSLDNELLAKHVDDLREWRPVAQPIYDYRMHRPKEETTSVEPARIIVVEGILVLVDERLRDRMDIKLFVDCDADVRFIRRMKRDVQERGRTLESVIEQYLATVRPMHLEFVEPSKRYADVIIPEGGHNEIAIDMIGAKITSILSS
ncbi:uridine kinase [bacterium]|nr:uridine kinase [bacterium]